MPKETIGEYLKRERELRQIPLEEVAAGTKIGINLLRSLEADRLEDLHAEVFVQGFIKSYAAFIGLSPEEVLLRYQEERAQNPPLQEPMAPVSSHYLRKSHKTGKRSLLLTAILLLLVLGAAAGYWFYLRGQERSFPHLKQDVPESLLVIPDETKSPAADTGSVPAQEDNEKSL